MINVIPIPLHMLIHTVEYHEYIGEDDTWGGSSSSYAPPVVLKRVRVQPNERLYNTSTGDSVTFEATLFHDSVNSSPANQVFKESMSRQSPLCLQRSSMEDIPKLGSIT